MNMHGSQGLLYSVFLRIMISRKIRLSLRVIGPREKGRNPIKRGGDPRTLKPQVTVRMTQNQRNSVKSVRQ